MKRMLLVVTCALVIMPFTALALHRDVRVIESATISHTAYQEMDVTWLRFTAEGELYGRREWAVVGTFGGGLGDHSYAGDINLWTVGLGFRRLFGWQNSLAILGSCEWDEASDYYVATGLRLQFEHRLVPADEPISPVAIVGFNIEGVTAGDATGQTENFRAATFSAGMGCDFEIRRDVVITLSGMFVDSARLSSSNYGNFADGWIATVGFRYYWR